MAKILDGIKIIDFTQGHTGSYGTMILADFGAEVIKIEDPGTKGDVLRSSFPKNEKGSAYHAYMNRGKKSVCIDRYSAKGQEMIMKLICSADVVCDCFVAGELESCGLGYEAANKENPKIIYASQTGFGKTGPLSGTAGSDLTSEALCGLMYITRFPDHTPVVHGSRIADQFGGVFLAFSIVIALMARERMQEGQQIDIASTDCMFTALEDCIAEAYIMNAEVEPEGNGSRAIAPYDTFEVKDGFVSTAVSTNFQWVKFCKAMGMEEWIDDPRYETNESRGEHYYTEAGVVERGLRDMIAERFAKMTKWEVEELLRPYNVPSGLGYTVPEAFENQQLAARNMVLEIEDKAIGKLRMPGTPIKISGISDTEVASAPLLGENTEELLKAVGYEKEEILRLRSQGTIMWKGGKS